MNHLLKDYKVPEGIFDEVVHDMQDGQRCYEEILNIISGMNMQAFKRLNENAKLSFLNQGITYAPFITKKKV